MAVAAWARPLAQTLQDALAFDRPGRFPLRDPITGEITGWGGARAPLPVLAPALAAAFPGRSPRALLGALERGRGPLHEQLREFARLEAVSPVRLEFPAGPGREPAGARRAVSRGAGSRLGAAGLWDCRRTRPTFYACIADGERLQRSPWGKLRVNPLPRGFGQVLRGLIRQGLPPRDAMREAWRRIRVARQRGAVRRSLGNPGAAWHEGKQRKAVRQAKAHRYWPAFRHYYEGKRDAHAESVEPSRALGLNPLTQRESRQLRGQVDNWRRAESRAEREHQETKRGDAARLASYYQGRGDQAGADLQTFGRGGNPQRAFDPFDYGTPTAAKRARDAFWRELRGRGVRARRWALPGQLEPWAGLGRKGRGIRTVYLVDWQENPRTYPTGPILPRALTANPPRPGTLPRPWGYLTQEVRLHRSKRYDPERAPQLTAPSEVLQFVKNLPESDRERVFAIYVDQRNRVLGVQPLAVGGTTSSAVPTDALLRGALLANATGVILVHNHPSGDPSPSADDRRLTAHLERTLPAVDLRLLDHLVVGRRQAASLKHGGAVAIPNPARRRRASRATTCPERLAPPGRFDPRSFRTVTTDGHRVTVGCPKGQYDARRRRCKVGTQAQRILHPPGEATCPLPGREVRPRRRRNPPAGAVELYRRVDFIGATKGRDGRYPGERFVHHFRHRARVLGLPDGSLLVQPAQGR